MAHLPRLSRPFGACVFAFTLLGCEPGGVGDPCVPEDEYQTGFAGFDEAEVNIESRSFQCETRVCVVNHFRGRVSCPYGQTEADLVLPGTDPRRCRIPGTSGHGASDVVDVPVQAQLESRQGESSVYCSCRCGGPDPSARYCECPSGFSCVKLIDDLHMGSNELVGSYCVKDGTRWEPSSGGTSCDRAVANCGNDGENP